MKWNLFNFSLIENFVFVWRYIHQQTQLLASFCSLPKIQFKLIHPHKPQCEFLETLSNVSCKIQIILFLKITANLGSKKEIGCGGIYWNWYSKMLNYKIWALRENGYNINKLCWNSPNYMYEINVFNNQTQLDLFVSWSFIS